MDIYAWKRELNDDLHIGCAGHFYLHGTLETENGYDICGMKQKDYPKTDGVYIVTVHFENGNPEKTALLFYWKSNGTHRGLVCNIDDDVAKQYAKKQLERKAMWI